MEKVNVRTIEQFNVKRWQIKVVELENGVGIVIQNGKKLFYLPPVVQFPVHVKLPKYVVEQLAWLTEQPDVNIVVEE